MSGKPKINNLVAKHNTQKGGAHVTKKDYNRKSKHKLKSFKQFSEECLSESWKKGEKDEGGDNIYTHSDGMHKLAKTGYHPTRHYAHNLKNKTWWSVIHKDKGILASYEKLSQAKQHHGLHLKEETL